MQEAKRSSGLNPKRANESAKEPTIHRHSLLEKKKGEALKQGAGLSVAGKKKQIKAAFRERKHQV